MAGLKVGLQNMGMLIMVVGNKMPVYVASSLITRTSVTLLVKDNTCMNNI